MTETTGEPRRVRAGDADRDRVVAALQGHREAGRLTAEEFEERMESALVARWLDELPPLLADLPQPEQARAGTGGPGGWRHERPTGWQPGPGGGAYDHPSGPQSGPPPWPGPWGGRRGPRFGPPFAPILLVLAVVFSVAAVAHGHFPFPLLWIAVVLFWWRPWWLRRRGWGWWPGRR